MFDAIDPGYFILEIATPALNIFRSETFAPDMSLLMVLSALGMALFYRYHQIGPACEVLRIRARFLKKCKNNRIFSNNFYEFDLLMREDPFIGHAWSEFIETCFIREEGNNSEGDVEITIRPSEYLNLHDAEHSGLRIRWFHALK